MKPTKAMIEAGAKALFESRKNILKWEGEDEDRKAQYYEIATTVLTSALKGKKP